MDPRDAIRTSIREASRPSGTFWVMNALATVIACYGLFSNSAAVVIGAMVVAMLLGPIAGIALGLTDKDHALLGAALSCLVGGIAWILLVAVVIGAIHRDAPLTEEIISRTSPTLFDLMIALAGGAAGGIATVSPRIGAAIVGVAIATALVPPLAASGILLARGDFDLAWNAFVLALTNVIAIQFAFSVVLWLNGFRGQTYVAGRGIVEFLRRNFVDVAIVCLLSAVLGLRLHHVITAALFESQVRSVLQQQAGRLSGTYVDTVRFDESKDGNVVRAVLRGPGAPSVEQVAAMQAALPRAPNGGAVELRVRFVKVVIMTAHGPLQPADQREVVAPN
ncbi:MAG: TIGR00341 family protein [Xanthobacteraceae bacterium]